MANNNNTNLGKLSPTEILQRGRELIRLARRKETELRQRQLLKIGEIFHREMKNSWATPWKELSAELEATVGVKIKKPFWSHQQCDEV